MKRLAAFLAVTACLMALHTSAVAAQAPSENPTWCRPGFRCIPEDLRDAAESATCEARPWWAPAGWSAMPTACTAAAAIQLEQLLAENDTLRARRARRFGGGLACIAGVASYVDENLHAGLLPTPGACGVGLTIRLGR